MRAAPEHSWSMDGWLVPFRPMGTGVNDSDQGVQYFKGYLQTVVIIW